MPSNIGPPLTADQTFKPRTFYPKPYYPYPVEYDARIHGPYDPARYYGKKPRVSLWTVKLGNMGEFMRNADFSPRNMFNVSCRWFAAKYARDFRVKRTPITPAVQFIFGLFLMQHLITFGILPGSKGGIVTTRVRKYHW